MDRSELQEQLDVCRSAAEAASDPDLRGLAEALAKDAGLLTQFEHQVAADRKIVQHLQDVETPPDLRERLALAFREGAQRSERDRSRMNEIAIGAIEARPKDGLSQKEIEPIRKILAPRRRYLGKLAGAAIVACACITIIIFLGRGSAPKEVDLTEAAFAANAALLCASDQGTSQPANSAKRPTLAWKPSELPFVPGVAPLSWKEVNSNFAGNCILWEISSPQGARAYLLMTRTPWKSNLLPSVVSRNPAHNSGGWSAGAWRRKGIAYALVVEGNPTIYGSLIQSHSIAQVLR